jgi:hypothetical protein
MDLVANTPGLEEYFPEGKKVKPLPRDWVANVSIRSLTL